MIDAGVQMCEGEAGRCSKSFDLGRPWLLGDGLSSQTTKVRPNVGASVAANLADEQISISDSRRRSGQQSAESFTE